MKKAFIILLLTLVLLTLSACNGAVNDETETSSKEAHSKSPFSSSVVTGSSDIESVDSNPSETAYAETGELPLPMESANFSFLSGAGAWRTNMTLNRDGTFYGIYSDSEMGEFAESYPNGSVYVCAFSGKFEGIEQISEYAFKMTLTDITIEKAVGEEWIEDGIRYIASEPYGLYDYQLKEIGKEFVFYLPNTPLDKVPEEFLIWWPYRYNGGIQQRTTLDCYGILNVATNDGFFNEE